MHQYRRRRPWLAVAAALTAAGAAAIAPAMAHAAAALNHECWGSNRGDWDAFHVAVPQSHCVRVYYDTVNVFPMTWPQRAGKDVWTMLSIRPEPHDLLSGKLDTELKALIDSAPAHSLLTIYHENAGGNPLNYPLTCTTPPTTSGCSVTSRTWFNARHPWNHNEHFHGWILRNLPARRLAALDVGCGTGVLVGRLAPHFACVTGIDADAGMAAAASARLAKDSRVTIRRGSFEQFASAPGDGAADLITMVAVLHHLNLDDTLACIPGLLAPGGRLLVIGLAKVNLLPDLAVDLISAAANPVMGMIKHPRAARPADGVAADQAVMPLRDPGSTLAEISAAARAHLPGATVRRRLFFRYTLDWVKPPTTTDRHVPSTT